MFVNILVNDKTNRQKCYHSDDIDAIIYNGKKSITVRFKPGVYKHRTMGLTYSSEEIAKTIYNNIINQLQKSN